MTGNLQKMVESEREGKQYLQNTVADYMNFVEQVSDGNLASKLKLNGSTILGDLNEDSQDLARLGVNLSAMVESLNTITRQVREAVGGITSSAAEILAATTQQNASSTEQDAAVTQTVATAEEVRATVQQTADRAQSVADMSQQSLTVSRAPGCGRRLGGGDAASPRARGEYRREYPDALRTHAADRGDYQHRQRHCGPIQDAGAQREHRSGAGGRGRTWLRRRGDGSPAVGRAVAHRHGARPRHPERNPARDQHGGDGDRRRQQGRRSGVALVERAGEAIRNLAATIEEAAQSAAQIAASTQQQTNGMDQLTGDGIDPARHTQTAASTRQTEDSARQLTDMAQQMEHTVARYRL